MIRQEILTSKQDDLTRCITSRELKLRQLYHATVTFLQIAKVQGQGFNDAKYYDGGETAFLEANKILEGRFFDPSTLPSLHGTNFSQGLPYTKVQPSRSLQLSQDLLQGSDSVEQRVVEPLHNQDNGTNHGIEKAKQHTSGTTLGGIDQRISHRRASIPNRTSAVEEISLRGENGAGLHVQPRSNEGETHGEANHQDYEEAYIVDPSPLTSQPVRSGLDETSEETPTKHGINAGTIPSASHNVAPTPAPVATALTPAQISDNSLTANSRTKGAEELQVDNLTSGGCDTGVKQNAETLDVQLNGSSDISRLLVVTQASDTLDSSSRTERSVANANPDLISGTEDSSHDSFPAPQDLKGNLFDSSGLRKNDLGTVTQPDSDRTLQPAISQVAPKFAGTPSTADEQLRLEEAQSMQNFKLPSNAPDPLSKAEIHSRPAEALTNKSSQFVHSELGGEDEDVSVHNSIDDTGLVQRDTPRKEYDAPEQSLMKPMAGLRDHAFSGMVGDLSKDLTLSRRPPMRIDTGVPTTSELQVSLPSKKTVTPSTATPYTPLSSSIQSRSGSSVVQAQALPERMTTRVSSGAIRHKSVSEILGETPKPANNLGDKSPYERANHESHRDDEASIQTPRSASAGTNPDPVAFKLRLGEIKGKERSKLSTVIFARPQPSQSSRLVDSSHSPRSDTNEDHPKLKDYLQPLFAMQAATPPISHPLHALITSAHKTLSTANHYTSFHEHQDCRMLERISQLQSANRWSLRQLERSAEPARPTAHWDVLLGQMKWMRTDFREERKWKITAAKLTADSCAEWVRSTSKERLALQIKTRTLPARAEAVTFATPTPELIPSAEDNSSVATDCGSPCLEPLQGSAPAAIFSLAPDMFYFGVDKTPVTEKLLLELPLYHPSIDYEESALSIKNFAPDAAWKIPVVPISKFVQGKIRSHEQGPPRKKSRYSYLDSHDSSQNLTTGLFLQSESVGDVIGPEQENVALFNPENKHIRDRIHAGHAFRPPSEHVMPSQTFFESRQSSQWTQAEDDELRRLVREYAYNWSLISSCLSSPSKFSSGAERRTPWECFERWIGLEGLPAEMSKTQYFKAYQSRLQAAQKTHEAQQQAMQQNQGNNTPHLPMRRRTTQPYLVDRRKNNKYLHLVDAMRKLAKKREAALHKQQHVAGLAAMRKSNEAVQPKRAMQTPQEFSRLKYDRECKVIESARVYRQQVMQQQKAAQVQKANQQSAQQLHSSTGMQPARVPIPGSTNGSSPNIHSSLSGGQNSVGPGNQVRQIPPMPRVLNGSQPNGAPPTNAQNVPHAPMQGHTLQQQRLPPQMSSEKLRIYHEVNRVQAEQQRYLQQQRQQQHPLPNGQPGNSLSPNTGHLNLMSQNNPALLGSLHGRSGSPSINGLSAPTGSSSSPQMTNHSQPQRLSSGVVPAVNQIQNTLKNRNPQASPEQIIKMTTEHLDHYRVNHPTVAAAAAMQAAAGPNMTAISNNSPLNILTPPLQQHHQPQPPMLNGVNGSPMLPQQYAQLRRNQQSQQSRSSSSIAMGRAGSRAATPQTHRSGSAQGGPPPSQSPRPSQVQMAGGH